MKCFKCNTCGGELIVSPAGELKCPYCGLEYVFSDAELSEYRQYRQRTLAYLRAAADRKESSGDADRLWEQAHTARFTDDQGHDITISHLFHDEIDGIEAFTSRRNVLYLFPADRSSLADRAAEMPRRLQYPSADTRDLSRCFPTLAGQYVLNDGRRLAAFSKPEEYYPLSAFGALAPEHAAWVLSRLENICCVLAYSGLEHGGIRPETIFINAATHEAMLIGGWWRARPCPGGSQRDLVDIRATTLKLMGPGAPGAPKEMLRFLKERPAPNAFDDFALWDDVIQKGFGGRRFVTLDTTNIIKGEH